MTPGNSILIALFVGALMGLIFKFFNFNGKGCLIGLVIIVIVILVSAFAMLLALTA